MRPMRCPGGEVYTEYTHWRSNTSIQLCLLWNHINLHGLFYSIMIIHSIYSLDDCCLLCISCVMPITTHLHGGWAHHHLACLLGLAPLPL